MKKEIITAGIATLAIGSIVLFGGTNEISKTKLETKFNASQEIKAKYQIDGTSLKREVKSNPKDRIEVVLGDVNATDFTPNVEIKRWDEVSFKLKPKLSAVATKDKNLSFVGDKVRYENGSKETIEMYELPVSEANPEGAYEIEWILKEKPATNIVEFDVETNGVDYFYQPPLTQKEIDEGASRPENVIGSYAVYASEQKTNYVGGKEYKVGKIGHIFRPKIIDSAGTEVWGDLHIENGILSVTIPQEFLDKGIYPIIVDPTIGYSTTGGSGFLVADNLDTANNFIGGKGTTDASGGNIDNLYVYIYSYTAGSNSISTKINVYNYTSDTDAGTTVGVSNEIEITSTGLKTLTPSGTITLAGSTNYFITYWGDRVAGSGKEVRVAFDFGAGKAVYKSAAYTGSFPSPLTGESGGNYGISIYATYTASGGGTAIPNNNVILFE